MRYPHSSLPKLSTFRLGLSALLLRLGKAKKKNKDDNKMVSVSTQTEGDFIEILVAERWVSSCSST